MDEEVPILLSVAHLGVVYFVTCGRNRVHDLTLLPRQR